MIVYFFFFKQKTAYEITRRLEFRRVLFRSGLGRGSAASIVPCTVEPAGITTCPAASFTSWLTDPVKASPALACRVVIVSLAASGTRVPAAAVSVVGAAGLGGGLGARFSGAALAGWVARAGTSFRAAVDSAGASVRLRAVESLD